MPRAGAGRHQPQQLGEIRHEPIETFVCSGGCGFRPRVLAGAGRTGDLDGRSDDRPIRLLWRADAPGRRAGGEGSDALAAWLGQKGPADRRRDACDQQALAVAKKLVSRRSFSWGGIFCSGSSFRFQGLTPAGAFCNLPALANPETDRRRRPERVPRLRPDDQQERGVAGTYLRRFRRQEDASS